MSDAAMIENVVKLFTILDIKNVVYVDDYNDEDISVEKVITSPMRNQVFEKFFSNMSGDEDMQNNSLRKEWDELSLDLKNEIKLIIQSETDKDAIPAFLELIPKEILLSLTPNDWEEKKDELLKNYQNTLFLFDQDLGLNEREDNEDGIVIISEISKGKDIICGLFTQIVTKDDCLDYRDKMSKKYNVERDKFLVISKKDVSINQALFIYFLKLTILCNYFMKFKESVSNIINIVGENAINTINNIGIEDFEHIIFKTPLEEGIWEPDMFFRIYAGFHRRYFINSAYANNELQKAISEIRSVSDIKIETDLPLTSKAWDIQKKELYDDTEHINKNHLPIEVGDIFEDENKKLFILLSQPCDLMIRDKGRRSRSDKRLTLVRIKKKETAEEKEEKNKPYKQDLWYYGTSKEEKWFVDFKDVFFVKDYILDLCVYNDDGISKYISNLKLNMFFRPSLVKRYKFIEEQIRKTITKNKELYKNVKENKNKELQKVMYEAIFSDDLFSAKYEQDENNCSIAFNCKRVGRLLYERAIGLLAEYCSVMQRPGYSPEYGQIE